MTKQEIVCLVLALAALGMSIYAVVEVKKKEKFAWASAGSKQQFYSK